MPMLLYSSLEARARRVHGRKVSGAFAVLVGGMVSLLSSVSAGTIPLDSSSVLLMVFPALGSIAQALLQTTWDVTFHTTLLPQTAKLSQGRIFYYYAIAFGLGNALIAAGLTLLVLSAARFFFPRFRFLLLLLL